MTQILRRYVQYRRIGYPRTVALRFAWMVVSAGGAAAAVSRAAGR